jgi:hypothetical protein
MRARKHNIMTIIPNLDKVVLLSHILGACDALDEIMNTPPKRGWIMGGAYNSKLWLMRAICTDYAILENSTPDKWTTPPIASIDLDRWAIWMLRKSSALCFQVYILAQRSGDQALLEKAILARYHIGKLCDLANA